RILAAILGALVLAGGTGFSQADDKIDIEKVKALVKKLNQGIKLTPEEQKYLERAKQELKKSGGPKKDDPKTKTPEPGSGKTIYTGAVKELLEARKEQKSVGFKPLTEMTAKDSHHGEDGGLYGGGKNEPPAAHQKAAQEQ